MKLGASSGNRFDVPFHLFMCVLWVALAVVVMTTGFRSLIYLGVGCALGIAGHALSATYGLWTMREVSAVYETAIANGEASQAREALLESEIAVLQDEATNYRARIAELERTQRPTRRDPETGRWVSRTK